MQWLILMFFVIWLVYKGVEGISESIQDTQKNIKYKDRVIDTTKDLYERNEDIITIFEEKITSTGSSSYYSSNNYTIENTTRDCINEICIAERRTDIWPNLKYLSNWRTDAPDEWRKLSDKIENRFSSRKNLLKNIEGKIERIITLLERVSGSRENPLELQKLKQTQSKGEFLIEELTQILTPNVNPWSEIEEELIKTGICSSNRALSENEIKNDIEDFSEIIENNIGTLPSSITNRINQTKKDIIEYQKQRKQDEEIAKKNVIFFSDILKNYKNNVKDGVIKRIEYILNSITIPKSIPRFWNVDFDPETGIAIVEVSLLDVVHTEIFKSVSLKKGSTQKVLTQKESREEIPNVQPATILRVAYEIFINDTDNLLKLLVVNGWVEFDNPSTGLKTKTYTTSLVVEKSQIVSLNLSKINPLSAFINLKGKSAGKLIDIIPVTPLMSLDRKDKRFIATKEVLNNLDCQTNLASMDWQEFENLIAELFQREFSEEGTEIKLTQSSRDKGVDAIVFNPDPIRGGKYVIQAKRYTNTVDVSAVRDLVAVVQHEGASRGILVTTSTFGADAYAFVQNKPITLLDGSKLLGLLEKHGYKFRINLAEARKLYPSSHKY